MKSSTASTLSWKSWSVALVSEAICSHKTSATRPGSNKSLPNREGWSYSYSPSIQEIRSALVLLGSEPGIGHVRQDLTDRPLKFWLVYSYLIVYDPETKPIQIIRVLHGRQHVENLLN